MRAHEAADPSAIGMPVTRTVLLLRHATADSPPATSDRNRPLSPHGRTEAATLGRWLVDQQRGGAWSPITTVLCSPALRTRETLQGLGLGLPVTLVEELYGGGVPDVVDAIAAVPPDAATVLVVGHAPGIPATAMDLDDIAAEVGDVPADRPVLQRFPPASLAVLQTTSTWSALGGQGAALVRVRHP